ncbi:MULTISPECIES: NUDIX domain-containing protein [Crocosphaera]|uniref:Nudix hydrolase family protein n=5 Tax=Crocosphaera watsonii TaxID=263511 RepID=T2K0S4_CROWT|nr:MULTISPECIES: NUDIX hydrolase [Crocosphaera]EHJ11012.1 ADP-ribose pyrophosphatase [Crocosphaera watsonii WH 0003]MCH2244298.1 NUDIX hydrolase [Crocosphaera sp.]NQZ60738.1 NUDIX hydrolase [Crocosphaera sp.]CCQ49588.1 ADP-ribose pyrophosphatase [Crocosphaera watsonii WH 8502]CCQ54222.1 ADP-ribose pyrophosphatase [Crocosphaera watsonii WH 0005]
MTFRNPIPTVDIIIELIDQPNRPIILIERKNTPYGWALPGGFVDYGETVENAASREAQEEVSLSVNLIEQFHVYSNPNRDERKHTMSIVFIATATGKPQAADDAQNVQVFDLWELPKNLCFDHDKILADYQNYRYYKLRPNLI